MSDQKVTQMPQPQSQTGHADETAAKQQASASALAAAALTAKPGVLATTPVDILAMPTPAQVIKFMATCAKLINRQVGVVLANESMTAANPACQGMVAAGSALEQGAMQLDQLLRQLAAQQQQAAGLTMPGQGGAGPQGGAPRSFTN